MKKYLCLLIVSFFVSACTPTGYEPAPQLSEYLKKQVPDISSHSLRSVSVCRNEQPSSFLVSMMFENKSFYAYDLDVQQKQVVLKQKSTMDERQRIRHFGDKPKMPCFRNGVEDNDSSGSSNAIFIFAFSNPGIFSNVSTEVAADHPFGDGDRQVLHLVSDAIKESIAAEKKVSSNMNSWL